ncbi:putative DNA-binding protein [Desulfosporosinus sp.]|uniref:putative DNA-binding protein n=1 Tax=Desulfosporosinus sp. TaxID=157907 RepID=UPI0023253537|nr:putative DNA-binding protein [Desulfosporosinus sp.]MCO5385449.1 putative DNA-binding protein [Desulfosporosinus sp.]MDA8223724.1 putative DNA-binding protein [Desulfitobacterium hafniense]
MEKLAKRALLVDFYGPLLTEKQRNVWDLHYQQDLSLTEIAEVEHISRQAIHDLLKRTERILDEYEDKLGLVQRFWTEREKLIEVQTLLQGLTKLDFSSLAAYERHQKIRIMIEDVFANIAAY